MKYVLGTKEEMTQIFDESGKVFPVTIVTVPTNVITQVKTSDNDGYTAVQVGAGEKTKKNVNKPMLGHLKDLGPFQAIKEFRLKEVEGLSVGDKIEAGVFEKGDKVKVSAISKGKGFQGVVKRYNFAGGPRTHGNKHHERTPGSIGAKGVARVFKGKKMPGRMGTDRVSVDLKVVGVEGDKLFIKGAIPGRRGTLVEIRSL